LHLRRVSCEAFQRDDGLLEIEGLLIDTKPTSILLPTGKEVPGGEAIHQMRVRLTVDNERKIVDASVFSEHSPYAECADIEAAYRQLIGMRIESGFTRGVKRLFRGTGGCTHISELIPPMATTYFQALWATSGFADGETATDGPATSPLGGCHALRPDGAVVRTYFPKFQKDPPK